ncbi:MAG TPA: OmpA family protein [Thermoanaerobaculia bacterium]|jgi:outer membrane protein OmpA-like peptidoglycan-associated protein|nr:OmpA family protein [Thermoanaerobaculia bacterium]
MKVPTGSNRLLVVGALLVGIVGLGGCATKRYVGEEVSKSSAAAEKRISEVQSQVEMAQSRVREHDTKLAELDKTTRDALERAEAAGKLAEGKFVYSLVLSDDAVKFPINRHQLSKDAQAKLTEFAEKLKSENKNVYLEIQGHTDSTGPDMYNLELGEARAEAVRRFLSKQGIALNRMSTISYGEDEPVAKNTSRQGRAQNRRVAVIVLS